MKRKTILALSLVTATVVGGAFAIPAIAGGWGPGGCGSYGMRGPGAWGQGAMMQQGAMPGGQWGNMRGQRGRCMSGRHMGYGPRGHMGYGPRGGMGYGPRGGMGYGPRGGMGFGPRGGMGMMNSSVFRSFDTDKDGTVSADEITKGVASLHKTYDADGNGSLSLSEFQALHAQMTRDFARRPFQMMDRNADGQISAEEMRFPAQMMARFAPVTIGTVNAPAAPAADAPDTK